MPAFFERLFASRDARSGLSLLLAGVVLVPSLALSVLCFRFIARLADAERASLLHDADGRRWHLEQQLAQALRLQALEAARALGTKDLASAPERVRERLAALGIANYFDKIHLDLSSAPGVPGAAMGDERKLQVERQALVAQGPEPFVGASGEEGLPLLNGAGEPLGLLRFRYTRAGQAAVVRQWFERDFSAPWDDDAVELFFDGTLDGKPAYDSFARQFIVRVHDPALWEQHGRTLGVERALATTDHGYVVELSLPWEHLGVRPAVGSIVGFDVGNDDDDDGGMREGQRVWSGSTENWSDTSGFGRVVLVSAPAPRPRAVSARPETVALPAPADLVIDGRLSEPAWRLLPQAAKLSNGRNDNSVRFALLWNQARLYVGVLVEDKHLVNDLSAHNTVWTVRVADPAGGVLYESEPTPDDRFDVVHKLTNPGALKDGTLFMRPRDRSVERNARRFKLGALALIGLIDLTLAGGLLLIYSSVRRQVDLARLKSDFVANVSHELKTPVALIHLFAETLESDRCPSEEKRRQYYRVLSRESQRLTALINNMLDFSRIEAGRKEYRFAPTPLPPILREVIEVYREGLEQQGFTVETHIDDTVPEVMADAEALRQSVMNLVSNAVKYSREQKYVRVELHLVDGAARISVEDRGIGVAPEEQTKIFEKFYRAEDSLVHETKGSGLGLALVRETVRAHGGRVELVSAPGRGSTFTLVLPIAEEGHESHADRRGRARHGDGAQRQLRA